MITGITGLFKRRTAKALCRRWGGCERNRKRQKLSTIINHIYAPRAFFFFFFITSAARSMGFSNKCRGKRLPQDRWQFMKNEDGDLEKYDLVNGGIRGESDPENKYISEKGREKKSPKKTTIKVVAELNFDEKDGKRKTRKKQKKKVGKRKTERNEHPEGENKGGASRVLRASACLFLLFFLASFSTIFFLSGRSSPLAGPRHSATTLPAFSSAFTASAPHIHSFLFFC